MCYLCIKAKAAEHARKGIIDQESICPLAFAFKYDGQRLFRIFWNTSAESKSIARPAGYDAKLYRMFFQALDHLIDGTVTTSYDHISDLMFFNDWIQVRIISAEYR